MLKSLSAKLGHVLVLYGGWGLFALSFLDSSFIPFPVVNDLAPILMASRRPALWPLYALASTLGSTCGAFVLYGIARGGGGFLWRKTTPQALTHAQQWLKRNDFVAILVAALLPPPAPLKVFILTAGLLRVNALRFGLALALARGLRFGAEAWLGARYGVQAQDYLRHNLGWASIAAVVMIVGLALLQRWWKRRVQDAEFRDRDSGKSPSSIAISEPGVTDQSRLPRGGAEK
jgi:membrane protein YqaA with SNARE-associated domain